jgi:DNA topoisomerase
MNKLILAEKPSTAKILAHVVGAREKIYSKIGKAFCYFGNGYYVVNARGHLYGLGEPEDYGNSKKYNIEELPMFPDFKIFPCGEDTEELRSLISELMNKDDIDEIICATDAGREGELIFRHIYEANHCTKPVKRLWCNSMTDEAIREQLKNLPPDSDFDGEYYAALARQKSDWIIGMNLSRLYGVLDNYAHHIGRVKTPVLSIIVERDNEIQNFKKSVSYRLEMPGGALSETAYDSREEAERQMRSANGKEISVISVKSEEKSKNRPLLHNLTSLQQEANEQYGYTAKETLDAAQSLYEKRLLTYPRTDCNYISEDMKNSVIRIVDRIAAIPEYAERADRLTIQGLNLDERVVNNGRMNGHEHHAIIPEAFTGKADALSEIEKNIYGLVVNRLLCAVDKPYKYTETNYIFDCNGITYKLKTEVPVQIGWKEYDREYKGENASIEKYTEGNIFTAEGITVKEIEAQPPKHYTDATLLSVMSNIDNRINDKSLKSAVSGKGIGTEATRAEVIEDLIRAGYAERNHRNIVSTQFGRDFIASVPDSVKSVERTAEWEQIFTSIKEKGISAEPFIRDVKDYVRSVIELEKSPDRNRTPVHSDNPNSPKREPVGICPRCGKNIYEGKKNYYCESGKDGCGFTLWEEDKFLKSSVTPEKAVKLLNGEPVKMKAVSRDGEEYEAEYVLEDTGKYINLKRISQEKKKVGTCPLCGKNVLEGKSNFYCESGKDGCGFTLWKEDRYNGISITSSNAFDLLSGKKIYKVRKQLNGEGEKKAYVMVMNGKYANIRASEEK